MSVFGAIVEEIRGRSGYVVVTCLFKGYECAELTLWSQPLLMRVILVGESVQVTEHGLASTPTVGIRDLLMEQFRLADPDSVERLLLFLDRWVEARK